MFRTVPLSIISSFSLYTQQWYIFSNLFLWNKTLHVSDSSSVHHQEFFTVHTAMVYTITVRTMKNPDDGQRNCPNRVQFYSKNKFEKIVNLVGFTI